MLTWRLTITNMYTKNEMHVKCRCNNLHWSSFHTMSGIYSDLNKLNKYLFTSDIFILLQYIV